MLPYLHVCCLWGTWKLFLYVEALGPIWGSLRHLPRHTMQTPTPWYLPLLPQLYQCTPFSYSPVLPEGFLYPLQLGLCLEVCGAWGPPLSDSSASDASLPPSTGLLAAPCLWDFIGAFADLIPIPANLWPMPGPEISKQERIDVLVSYHRAVPSLLSKAMEAEV